MALPRDKDPYDSYTDQLVYFSARLGANPETAALAIKVDSILTELDQAFEALRATRRAEVRKRAERDHRDGRGDLDVRSYRRRLGAVADIDFVTTRLFPKGVGHVVAPRGRPQLERLDKLVHDTDAVLASPRLAAHPNAAELTATLGDGKQSLVSAVAKLREVIEAWEAQVLEVSAARDVFNFRRADGIGRLGAILGELRALLGGSNSAAYGFTQPGRSNSASETEDAA